MTRVDGKRSGTIVFDDLAFKLTPSERIIFGIIHRFSGYALGECRLKPTRIAEVAGVSRSTVYNVTKRLRDLGMIETVRHQKASGAHFTAFRVIKDRLDDTPQQSAEVIETQELANLETRNDQGGDETQVHGNSVVNELFAFWLETVEKPVTSRIKANRRAAWNLAKKYSKEELEQMIRVAAVARFNEFAPAIADFVDLQSKWQQLSLWAEKRANAELMRQYESMSIENRVKWREENPNLATIIDNKRKAV